MKLIVYHGSDNIIYEPKHNGGRNFSDFGRIGKYFDELKGSDLNE